MKIATWNVNGIRARHLQVLEWVERESPDVICLQELKATREQIPAQLTGLDDYWSYWHGGPRGYSGVSIHIRKRFYSESPAFHHPSFDFENRIVAAKLGDLEILSIYVPNGGKSFPAKMRFLKALFSYAEDANSRKQRLILCGDFNVARQEIDVHPKERGPYTGQTPEERALFQSLLDAGFSDVGREFHPNDEGMFTWWAPWRNMKARNIGWRLDYLIADVETFDTARSCEVDRETGTSDHAPVTAVFREL